MKKLAYIGILLTLAVVPSCSTRSVNVADQSSPASTPESARTPAVVKLTTASSSDLEMIRKYAESYEPRSGREVIPSPPVPNEMILKIITDLANTGSREHEKYIVLIFLRLSRFQIEHFKQHYELGRENPLTKEFYRLIGNEDYDKDKVDFMPSYLADNYVEKHPELLEYQLIDAEMKRIAKASEKIMHKVSK